MIDPATLFAICNTAVSTVRSYLELKKLLAGNPLSAEEKELLTSAAAGEGRFQVITSDCGTFVFTYKRDFQDLSNPSVTARYLDAFRSLCKRGTIDPLSKDRNPSFQLNSVGWDLARSLNKPE